MPPSVTPEHRPETVITRLPTLCLWGFVSLLLHHLLIYSVAYLLSYSSLPVSPRKESAGQGSVLLSGVPAPENPWCHVSGVFTGGASHLSFRACGFLPGGEGLVLNPSAAWARANRRQTCCLRPTRGSGSRTPGGWRVPAPWVLPGTRQVRATPGYACAVCLPLPP